MVGLGITPKEASKKHRLETIYEVGVHDIENRSCLCFINDETSKVYLTMDDAKVAARMVANEIARLNQCETIDNPDFDTEKQTLIVCIFSGRKYSKMGTMYGFKKIIYVISSQTKEVTDRFTIDKRFKNLQIDEYTKQPKLTKDMFYQWDENE